MFQIDFASRVPIYEQIVDSVIKLSSAGVLRAGDKIPPVRTLAAQLGINPNTVAKAYRILEEKGYIYSTVGRGSFVSENLDEKTAKKFVALNDFRSAVLKAKMFGATISELYSISKKCYEEGVTVD
ncbi:MAG: GntR family transcriptional regulator [Ruminococcus sp.]|nr:GntR family transcriptional regulator [Ruminococcus sp.]